MIRAFCNINTKDSKAANISKLCARYLMTEDELKLFLAEKELTIDDVVSDDTELLATVPDVIAKHIVEYWNNHINEQVSQLSDVLPHSDQIAFMLMSLLGKLGVKKDIADKIDKYYAVFDLDSLPNAIADYASLTLNNFVSTAGRKYMSDEDIKYVAKKAEACQLDIDLKSSASSTKVKRQPLLDVLDALDRSRNEMNNVRIDMSTLKKLPFWDSYQRWENFIAIGLLYASDISQVNPIENAAVKQLMDLCNELYN